jgi:hypothetical protein
VPRAAYLHTVAQVEDTRASCSSGHHIPWTSQRIVSDSSWISTTPIPTPRSRRKEGNAHHITGYVQLDLPPTFDVYADFTLSGWILAGFLPGNAFALSIECADFPKSIIRVGEFSQKKFFQMEYCTPDMGEKSGIRLDAREKYNFECWHHIAVVQQRDRITFYIDGKLQDAREVVLYRTPLTKVSSWASLLPWISFSFF